MSHWLTRLSKEFKSTNLLLVLLGVVSLALYRVGLRSSGTGDIKWFIKLALVQSVLYLLAAWIVVRLKPSRTAVWLTIIFAVLFRLAILFHPPYLSDDIYRYIWDGRVQSAGINPYRYVPAAPELSSLRDDRIYPKINRRDYAHTIYPPLAQLIFFLTTRISESVTWMKLTIFGFELLVGWTLLQLLNSLGMPRQRLLLYAWHPLIVWEFAGSGHVDAVAIALIALGFLTLQRNLKLASGCALAGATLIKLFPLVLLPAIHRKGRAKLVVAFVTTIVVAYLPYLSVGSGVFGYLPGYAKEEKLISGEQYYLLSLTRRLLSLDVPPALYFVFVVVVMALIALWSLRRTSDREGLVAGMLLATATTVLFAPHYSWYFTWLVPFLCFRPAFSLIYLTATSFLLYGSWLGDRPEEMFRLNSCIYLPFFIIASVEVIARYRALRLVSSGAAVKNQGIANREG